MSLKSFVRVVSGLLLVWLTLAYFHPTTAPAPRADAAATAKRNPQDQDGAVKETAHGLVVSDSPVAASHD